MNLEPGDLLAVSAESAVVYDLPLQLTPDTLSKLLSLTEKHRIGVIYAEEGVLFLGEQVESEYFSGGGFCRVVTRFGVGWIVRGAVTLTRSLR